MKNNTRNEIALSVVNHFRNETIVVYNGWDCFYLNILNVGIGFTEQKYFCLFKNVILTFISRISTYTRHVCTYLNAFLMVSVHLDKTLLNQWLSKYGLEIEKNWHFLLIYFCNNLEILSASAYRVVSKVLLLILCDTQWWNSGRESLLKIWKWPWEACIVFVYKSTSEKILFLLNIASNNILWLIHPHKTIALNNHGIWINIHE